MMGQRRDPKVWSPSDEERALELDAQGKKPSEIGKALGGRSSNSVSQKLWKLKRVSQPLEEVRPATARFTVQQPPKARRTPLQVIAERAERYNQKADRWNAKHGGLIVRLDEEGPYGVALFGDPHVDDDGTSMDRLAADMDLVRNHSRLHAVNMGDITNNWVGKLGYLYGQQGTTEDEAADLIDHLAKSLPWVAWILGNHDKWGPVASLVAKQNGIMAVAHGCRLLFQSGGCRFVLDCRHDYPGRSMYSPAHGPNKMAYRGSSAHVSVAGHTHQSGYMLGKNGVTQHVHHALRVCSYKEFDEYADTKGFLDEAVSPCVIAVVDPSREGECGFVNIFHDPNQGVIFLDALVREWEGNGKADE